MVVECPACKTRYRVDAGLVTTGETSFECCQEDCGHIFVYTPPVLWKGHSPEPASDAEPLSFSSQPESPRENERDHEDESGVNGPDSLGRIPAFVRPESEPPPPAEVQGRAEQAGRDGQAEQDGQNKPDEPDKPDKPDEQTEQVGPDEQAGPHVEPVSEGHSAPDPQAEPLATPQKAPRGGPELPAGSPVPTPVGPDEDAEPELRMIPATADSPPADEPPEAPLSVRTVFALIGFFVCGYALLGYSALCHPRHTKLVLHQLPVVGKFFAVEPFSARHIRLDKLSGSFWLSKDNRRVFAVAGTALNTASVSAKLVQIEGTLYNGIGKRVRQQFVFCGHEANAALLESLTVRDMDTLQKLVPPKDFHIPAGQVVKCLLVFTRPPGSVSEISGRVVSVQFEDV